MTFTITNVLAPNPVSVSQSPFKLSDNAGRITRFQFNRYGQLQQRRLANGDETCYQYDKKGRLLSCRLEDGAWIHCRYDHEDNLIEYHDRGKRVTKFAYFGQGRLAQQTLPDGHHIHYHDNTEEQLIGVTNQRGERRQLVRDALGPTGGRAGLLGKEPNLSL